MTGHILADSVRNMEIVNYGTSSDDEYYSMVDISSPEDTMNTSPEIDAKSDPLDDASEISDLETPRRIMAPRSEDSAVDHVNDLLHRSPRLHNRLKKSPTANPAYNPIHSQTLHIPDLDTHLLDSMDAPQKMDYLTAIKKQAIKTSERGVPFLVFKNGRSCVMTGVEGENGFIRDPESWVEIMLAESRMRMDARAVAAVSDTRKSTEHTGVFRHGWEHLKKKLTQLEITELQELRQRGKLGEMALMKPLTRKEMARLKELEIAAEEEAKLALSAERRDQHESKVGISGKAKRVLGVDSDRHYTRPNEDRLEEERDVTQDVNDKTLRRKAAFIGNRRRGSKSSTDTTSTAAIIQHHRSTSSLGHVSTKSSNRLQPMRSVEEATQKLGRTALRRLRSPITKIKSNKAENKHNDDDVFAEYGHVLGKREIGMPILQKDPNQHLDDSYSDSCKASLDSSDYSGHDESSHTARGLRITDISPQPKQTHAQTPVAKQVQSPRALERSAHISHYSNISPGRPTKCDRSIDSPSGVDTLLKRREEQYPVSIRRPMQRNTMISNTDSDETVTIGARTPTRRSVRRLDDPWPEMFSVHGTPDTLMTSYLSEKRRTVVRAKVTVPETASPPRALVFKPRIPDQISKLTPLGSNAPTDEERAFARILTRRNKAAVNVHEFLMTPTNTKQRQPFMSLSSEASDSEDSVNGRRPHTAPELPMLAPKKYVPITGVANMRNRGKHGWF